MRAFAAIDIGAQTGRVALGRFDGSRLSIEVVHRFSTSPAKIDARLRWDARAAYADALGGLRAAAAAADIASVGVDSWGVDFGLLDRDGGLIESPVHYRDSRRADAYETALAHVSRHELYTRTGIQLMPINSVFELAAMAADSDPALAQAEQLLLLPDLFHYWLCGARTTEFTNATTTQCLDMRSKAWAFDLLDRLAIPAALFPDAVEPLTTIGGVADEGTGIPGALVVAGATHDTASAVVGTPLGGENAAFLSVGTWSLVGVESTCPVADDSAYRANISNEGGVANTFRVLRNVTGLWVLDECRRAWARRGADTTLPALLTAAEASTPLLSFIDPNDPAFASPGDMPGRIATYCERTGQRPPESEGAIARCVLESLALKHAETIGLISEVTGRRIDTLHVVGGGAKNPLLCQWTASAAERQVKAGPSEATLAGNLVGQGIALGEIASLQEARAVVERSFPPTVHDPVASGAWREARERFDLVAGRAVEAMTA